MSTAVLVSYVVLCLSVGPAEGRPLAHSASSAGWIGLKRATFIVAVSMALGVLFGSLLGVSSVGAKVAAGAPDLLSIVSAAVAALALLSRAVPVSISQIVISAAIGLAIRLGYMPQTFALQAAFWFASPILVFLLTPPAYGLLRRNIMRASSLRSLDLTLKVTVNLSLILLSFWRGVNVASILVWLVAQQSNYWLVGLLTAGVVMFSCLFMRLLPTARGDMAYYPDPSAFASRALSSLSGVILGLVFGVTASFTQLFYASDLYFFSKMFVRRKHLVNRFLLSCAPALVSALSAFLLLALLG